MTLTRFTLLMTSAALLAQLGAPAAAQQPPAEPGAASATLDIRSEHLTIDPDARHATFEGDVQLRRGTLHLRCARLEATVDPDGGEPSFVHATGDVRVSFGDLFARAADAEYDQKTSLLTLTGTPVLWRGGTRVEGLRVSIDVRSRAVRIDQARGTLAGAPLASPPASPPEAAP